MNEFLAPPGQPIPVESLTVAKAQAVAVFLLSATSPFARFIAARSAADSEFVVVDVDVEVTQLPQHDIRPTERLAIFFDREDRKPLKALALRSDFPLVPHLNQEYEEFPRSLCLYDERYDAVKLHWTAAAFLERIRSWLALTARGELHADDQVLEPFLLTGPAHLIVPHNLFQDDGRPWPETLEVGATINDERGIVLRAERGEAKAEKGRYVATLFRTEPLEHGIIRRTPQTLADLQGLLVPGDLDCLAALRGRLAGWDAKFRELPLLIIVALPKTRRPGGLVEAFDVAAFLVPQPIGEIGVGIGLWQRHGKSYAQLLQYDVSQDGSAIGLQALNVHFGLTPKVAAQLNGLPEAPEAPVVAVGAGALGSQTVMNLARTGLARWTIVDADFLFPHNLARHQGTGFATGHCKAESLAWDVNSLFGDSILARAVVADALNPSEPELENALSEAALILDFSASVPAARHLALDRSASARRGSFFLSPTGGDLVALVEDHERCTTLDVLEMQYYRELIHDPLLANHLQHAGGRYRYAASCRDVTSRIPQHLVALHSATAAQVIRGLHLDPAASIRISQSHAGGSLSVRRYSPAAGVYVQAGPWQIKTDEQFLETLLRLRRDKLPRETGGVVLGTVDHQRHIVYLVDTIASPVDSVEWPTMYVRGCEGLADGVQHVEEVTAGMLGYVGEWHSHPPGVPAEPSSDDRAAFDTLAAELAADGQPAVMLIVADDQVSMHVERLDNCGRQG